MSNSTKENIKTYMTKTKYLLLIMVLMFIPHALADTTYTITLQNPGIGNLGAENIADADMMSTTPNTNYGSDIEISVGLTWRNGDYSHSYTKWSNGSIPHNATINSAIYMIYGDKVLTPLKAQVAEVYDNSWTELGINYGNQPCPTRCNSTFENTTKGAIVGGWNNFTITNMVQNMTTNGKTNWSIYLKPVRISDNGIVYFYSRNYNGDITKRQKVIITYTVPTVPPIPPTNTLPVITSNVITPTTAYSTSTLSSVVTASDVDGDTVTFSYLWYKDNISTGITTSTLSNLSVGASYYVSVTPNDGHGDGIATNSNTVTIVDYTPSDISGLSAITCNFCINWSWNPSINADLYYVSVNGTQVQQNSLLFYNGTYLPHSQKVMVVTPHNSTENINGISATISTTIPNNPPTVPSLIQHDNYNLPGTTTVNFTNSTDLDSDDLTYDIKVYNTTTGVLVVNQTKVKNNYSQNFDVLNYTNYSYTARAYDGYEYSSWAAPLNFGFFDNQLKSVTIIVTVQRNCGTESGDSCIEISPPIKMPVSGAKVDITGDANITEYTNESGQAIFTFIPHTGLTVNASKDGQEIGTEFITITKN